MNSHGFEQSRIANPAIQSKTEIIFCIHFFRILINRISETHNFPNLAILN